jgi:cytidine deaminase
VFRSIVNAATIDVSDDGVLQGVTFKNHVLSIAACAEEVHHVMAVVKHRAKIQARCCFRSPVSRALHELQ